MINLKEPIVIGFYGKSESGKTFLIERIIRKLSDDGYRIASIKKTNKKISIDNEGKDTSRFGKAGAGLVVLASPVEISYLVKEENEINNIIQHIKQLGKYNFIFIEGANEKQIRKIRLGNIQERENTMFTYDGDLKKLIKMIKNIEF